VQSKKKGDAEMKLTAIGAAAVLSATAMLSADSSNALPASPAEILSAAALNELVTEVRARSGRRTSVRRSGVAGRKGITRAAVARRNAAAVARPRVWPVTPWAWKPYFGTVVAGATLGSIISVTTAGAAPRAPASNVCWYWTEQSQTKGYWSYC
jgi:hypothetical protein